MLLERSLIVLADAPYAVKSKETVLLRYYANSIAHLLLKSAPA